MDNSDSKVEEELSLEQKSSQDSNTEGFFSSHCQRLGQEGYALGVPHHRLVIVILGLLNAVLLIAAVVIGIYCAQAQGSHLQDLDSATLLMTEMTYLRNSSGINKAKLEAQTALEKERVDHVQLRLQLKRKKSLTDSLQGQIEMLRTEKANLQSNTMAFEDSCGRCRPGWILLKSSCYYFSSRHSSFSKKNWFDSRADCINQGGDLLVINDFGEQELMSENFPKLSSSYMWWWQKGFWIGLTDSGTPGTWVWVNNATGVDTTYWRGGQPHRDAPQSGNCAAFYYNGDTSKTWYNGNCHDHLYSWICEMEQSRT